MAVQQYDLFGDPIPDDPQPGITVRPATPAEKADLNPHSYGRRLTEALRAVAAQGINPLVNTRGPDSKTCGDCIHRQLWGGHARNFPKCDLGPRTNGPKTDVRASWPACHRFEEKPQ